MNAIERIIDTAVERIDTLAGEDYRKVEYVVNQYLAGDREEADIIMLTDSIKRIVIPRKVMV